MADGRSAAAAMARTGPQARSCIGSILRSPAVCRLLNRVTRPITTDITWRLDDIVRDSGVSVTQVMDEPAWGEVRSLQPASPASMRREA